MFHSWTEGLKTLRAFSPLQQAYCIVLLSLALQYIVNTFVYFNLLPDIAGKSLNGFLKNSSYWIPACMALLGSYLFLGMSGIKQLFIPYGKIPWNPLWWIIALGILTPVAYLSLLLNDVLIGASFSLYTVTPPTLDELITWTPMFVQVAISDELLWIGFLYPRLIQAGYSSRKAAMVIGLFWGMDYIPFMFTEFFVSPGLNGVSIVMGFFSLAPIYIWLYEKTKSALIPITFNVAMQFTFSALPVLPHVTGDNAAVSMTNLLCFATGLALWYLFPNKQQSKESKDSEYAPSTT